MPDIETLASVLAQLEAAPFPQIQNTPTRLSVQTPTISFAVPRRGEQERERRERDQGRGRGRGQDDEASRLDWSARNGEPRRTQRRLGSLGREREIEVEDRIRLIRVQQAEESARLENWQTWFPFQLPRTQEINEVVINWLRPKEFAERMDILSNTAASLTTWIVEARKGERGLQSLSESFEDLRAQMGLRSVAARLAHVRKHLRTHALVHDELLRLYTGPTSEMSRFLIENLESRLSLPRRSCFFGNYRVGFGDIQDYLERDPALRETADRAELAGTSIAHLPAWEFPNDDQRDLVYAPPPGWRAILSRDEAPPSDVPHQDQRGQSSAILSRRERATQDELMTQGADEIIAASPETLMYQSDSDIGEMEAIDAQGSEDDADDEDDEMPRLYSAYSW